MRALPSLEAIEFLGVCQILGVPLTKEEGEKDFKEMLYEVIVNYCALPRKRQKELLRLIRGVKKENGLSN